MKKKLVRRIKICERIETINRHYEALEYEINKQAALKKISTLHSELKFKDNNNFSDRFLQTASVIEKNSSVFKSACKHVDIVTTLIDNLYSIGMKIIFAKNSYPENNSFNIIYLMFIVCNEREIPAFLEMAIINNSTMAKTVNAKFYESLISDYIMEMIVFEDADLYAVISYLKIEPFFFSKVKKIFVEEPIKQKFVWLLEQNFKYCLHMDLPIYVFHSEEDIVKYSKDYLLHFNIISIWSEDIISAKTLAVKLQKDVIFINTHLDFGRGLTIRFKKETCFYPSDLFDKYEFKLEDGDKLDLNAYTGSVYNLFYNGTWHEPVKDTYYIHNGNKCAHATREDINKCIDSTLEAFKSWSNLSVRYRREILLELAKTFEYNGKFSLAKLILNCIQISYTTPDMIITYEAERLKLITINVPRGITFLEHDNEAELFTQLTLHLITGNCVIVLCNKNSLNLAPYCDMFSTAEIPPGVINFLSINSDIHHALMLKYRTPTVEMLMNIFVSKNIILLLE